MIRALETFTFGLFLFGWLLLGAFGTWTETAPFWIGAPMLWLAALCGLFSIRYGLQGKLSRSCTVTVMLFTGYILWRALASEVVYLARPDVVFCATAFIAWVLIATRYEKPRHRFALLAVWSVIILGNLGMGLWQKHLNPNANALSFLGFGRDTQDAVFCGLFPNSNHLCGFLELAAFPILALAVFGRVHSFVRMLCGLVFIAAAYSVAQSTSRGGLAFGVGLIIFGAVAGVLHIMRRRRVPGKTSSTGLIFAAMAIVCSAIGWITWTQLEAKFGQGNVFHNMNGRTELWSRAQEQWLQSPVIGTGARSFEYYETKFRSLGTPWITWSETDINARFAHNDWVQVLSDYGLIGLLLAAAVLGFHCWKALSYLLTDSYRSAREGGGFFTDHRGAIVMGALCGMIAFAIHCMADFQMHIGVNAVLAASVLALMANPGRAHNEKETPVPAGGAWKISATLAAAIPAAILGWCFLPWAESDRQFYKARGIYDRAVGDVEDFFLASAKMQEAADADPLNYNAWLYWGYADAGSAQIFAGSPQFQRPYILKALERFKTAHRLYPQNADISANIARMLDSIGSFDEAGGWFGKALEWGDGSRLIHWWYADHLMATGRYQEALDHYGYIVHRHKYGGYKRNAIQKSIDRCQELLRKAQPPTPAPQ